jgi:hypothetical protein
MIKRVRQGDPDGRELRFMLQRSLGPAAIQYRAAGSAGVFPTAQQISVTEHSAIYKEINSTIELEYNLWDRARRSPSKYAEPLALEIQSKTTAAKRRLAADLYGDGTGAVAEVASVASAASAGVITIRLPDVSGAGSTKSAGHVGFCEYGDLLVLASNTGTVQIGNTVGGVYALRVKDRSRRANTVTLEAVDANGTVVTTADAAINAAASAGDHLYRVGQPTVPDRTAITDYATATEVMAGLKSLAAADGRTVHGVQMSGTTAGTVLDAAAAPMDTSLIEEVMNTVKVQVGQSAYKWKMMSMAPEQHAKLVASREADRRFITKDDAVRGIKVFGYQHGNDFLESYTSEYIGVNEVYMLPEATGGNKVLEFHGTDFEPVKMGGMGEFHLKPSASGGFERKIASFMQALVCLVCKHPASIAKIERIG